MPFELQEMLPFLTTFLFVFAVFFGLLVKANLFGGINTRVSAVIAIVVALISAVSQPVVIFLQSIIPVASIILVILFFLIFLKSLFEGGGIKDNTPVIAVLAILLMVLGALWNKIGISVGDISSTNVLWIIGIVVILLIFYAAWAHSQK